LWNKRRELGAEYLFERTGHNVRKYRNNDELYSDKDIDAVIISTPDFSYALHTIEAAQSGKAAYVEKPFAETMEDNRRALAAVKKSGFIVQIGSQRRSGKNYYVANKYIRSGKFGNIVIVEMCWNVNQPCRWRLSNLVKDIKELYVDWKRFLLNRLYEKWDSRKYFGISPVLAILIRYPRTMDVTSDRYCPLVYRIVASQVCHGKWWYLSLER